VFALTEAGVEVNPRPFDCAAASVATAASATVWKKRIFEG